MGLLLKDDGGLFAGFHRDIGRRKHSCRDSGEGIEAAIRAEGAGLSGFSALCGREGLAGLF
jgi:hypothetical protein